MSEPNPTDQATWEYLVGGLVALGGLVAAVGRRAKRWVKADPDYEAMARAFFDEKDRSDAVHRDAIVGALHEVKAAIEKMIEKQEEVIVAVRESNEKTRERFGDFTNQLVMLIRK